MSVVARVAVVTLAGLAAACTGGSSPPGQPPSPSAVVSPIVIDGQVGEVLTPTPASHPRLSAQQAWVRYTASSGHPQTAVPKKLRVVLGRLTLPPQYLDRLVWAYGFGPATCLTTLPKATPPTGIEWTFVDASSGRMLESTCQRL